MKPTKFDQATNFLPASTRDNKTGKVEPVTYHFYQDPAKGFTISCLELTREEIRELKKTGKLWVVMPGSTFIPYNVQIENPFTPKMTVSNGKENQTPKSSGNNEQPDKGDH